MTSFELKLRQVSWKKRKPTRHLRDRFYREPLRLAESEALAGGGGAVPALLSPILFTLFQGVGHALVDVLDLPILGQEEDAADQLAVLLLNEEPVMAMWAAKYWNRSTPGLSPGQVFTDAHNLNEQRFYNITCRTYGADPLTRGDIVEYARLPPERARNCQNEINQFRAAWGRLLGDRLTSPDGFGQSVRNSTGSWRFMESMADDDMQARCSASGTLVLWQLVESISGTMEQQGSCVYFGIPTDNAAPPTPITTGAVNDSGVSFQIADCKYNGTFEDDRRMGLSGSVVCRSLLGDGSTFEMAGTWNAVR